MRDALGNTVQQSVEITRIDTTKPILAAFVSQKDEWSKSKTVTLMAQDDSGIHTYEYSYDGYNWFLWAETLQVNNNCKLFYRVTDVAGNRTSSALWIDHIDNIPPKLEADISQTTEGVLTVWATDKESGLSADAYAYSLDGIQWSSWTSSNTYTTTEDVAIYVKVRDALGNITGENGEYIFFVPAPVIDVIQENIEDANTVSQKKIVTIKEVAKVATGTTSTVALTLGFVFAFAGIGNVKLYGITAAGKKIKLCNTALSKKKTVRIPQYRLKKNPTNTVTLRLNQNTLKKYEGELLDIKIGDHIVSKPIQKEITISY